MVAYGCSDVLYTTPWVQQVTASEVDNSNEETTTSAAGTTAEEGYLYILVELNLNGTYMHGTTPTAYG